MCGTLDSNGATESAWSDLVPRCAGVIYAKLQREGLWDKFYMDSPARQRQYVEHCNIVKKACTSWLNSTGSTRRPSPSGGSGALPTMLRWGRRKSGQRF